MKHKDTLKLLFPIDLSGSRTRSGKNTSLLTDKLADSSADFLAAPEVVHEGDVVINTVLGTQATVTAVDRDTADSSESHSLSLSADIFTALGQDYEIVLGGTFGADITVEGRHLDDAQAGAGDLIEVMFLSSSAPDELEACLPDWERVFNIVPDPSDLLDPRGPEKRRDRILTELKKVGGLSKPYFIQLAASMGYTVTITDNIEEFRPFMTGWGRAGDRLYRYEVIWIWKVHAESRPLDYFEAGVSEAGDYLLSWDSETKLENLFNELKPAHTYVLFDYS